MHQPNEFQSAIYEDVKHGTGHTVVEARAGTGKTTTTVAALQYIPSGEPTLLMAFNKSIAEELQRRVPRGVDVKTSHAYGLGTITKSLGSRPIEKDKSHYALQRIYPTNFPREHARATSKLVSLAKSQLADTAEELDNIVDEFGLIDGEELRRDEVIKDALAVMEMAKTPATDSEHTGGSIAHVDFDDMIWLPVVLGLQGRRYKRLFIDELQDWNRGQTELALRAVYPDARICAVGDPRQAIYRFRGADADSIAKITARLGAKTLPLSITYRCARSIVALANQVVPDLQCAPDAPEGLVASASPDDMMAKAAPGDFVISRTNAPLVGMCLELIRSGRRATVKGRDIGTNLVGIVRKAKAATVGELLDYVAEWSAKESLRLLAKVPAQDDAAQTVLDKAACIEALAQHCRSVEQVCGNIESLFSDVNDANAVTFTTTHKAKGLEAHRVWMLADTYRRERSIEEANLWYVSCTRAKRELYLVRKNG